MSKTAVRAAVIPRSRAVRRQAEIRRHPDPQASIRLGVIGRTACILRAFIGIVVISVRADVVNFQQCQPVLRSGRSTGNLRQIGGRRECVLDGLRDLPDNQRENGKNDD